MALPRFRPPKLMKGRDANLILDAIETAVYQPVEASAAVGNGVFYNGVMAVLAGRGVSVNQPTGNVVITSTVTGTVLGRNSTICTKLAAGESASYPSNTWTAPKQVIFDSFSAGADAEVRAGFDSDGVFTAPVSGVYIANASLTFDTLVPFCDQDNPCTLNFSLFLNGADTPLDQWRALVYTGSVDGVQITLEGLTSLSLSAGQSAMVYAQITGDSDFGLPGSSFNGGAVLANGQFTIVHVL